MNTANIMCDPKTKPSIAGRLPRFQQIQQAFTANIRNPENTDTPPGIEERRMAVYRELVYNNIEDLLSNFFPVMKAIMPEKRWHEIIRDFVIQHKSRTPIFMELANEFAEFLQQEFKACQSDPGFLPELAHYEWLEIALHTAQQDIPSNGIKPDGDLLDDIPIATPLVQLGVYQFPVHKISPEFMPDTPQPCFLLVYRDKDDEVQFMETNQMAARLLEIVIINQHDDTKATGRQLLEQIASELQHPNPGTVIEGGLKIMKEWLARDILLGTREKLAQQ